MITSGRFTNVNGQYVDFNNDDNRIPFRTFTTEVDWRFNEKSRSQRHGIYPGESYLGKRVLRVEGDLFGDNSADYIQRRLSLVGALTPRPQYGRRIVGTLDLLFDGMSEHLTCECTLDGHPELPVDAGSGRGPSFTSYMIAFKSFDPRLYGNWQSVNMAYNPVAQNIGGRGYNKTFNKIYTTPPNPGVTDILVVNSGNIETFPLATIYGPCTSPQISLQRSDGLLQFFRLIGLNLPSVADFVVVDFQKHTVVTNSGANAFNFAAGSDWWSIEPFPFTNIVRYSADLAAVPSHATIQWRNAYNL